MLQLELLDTLLLLTDDDELVELVLKPRVELVLCELVLKACVELVLNETVALRDVDNEVVWLVVEADEVVGDETELSD